MCDIWREKDRTSLSISDIEKSFRLLKPPYSVALTGGEPLLNPDFENIYKKLFLDYLKKKVVNIDISTNATTDKICNFIKKHKKFLGPLSLSISLDGLAKSHDAQRGVAGAFMKTLKNIQILKRYGIPISIKFTITPNNYNDVSNVYLISKKLGCEFLVKLAEKNPNYYNRSNSAKNFSFIKLSACTKERLKNKLSEILKLEKKQKYNKNYLTEFAIEALLRFLETGKLDFIKSCVIPGKCVFITSFGKIYPCLYYKSVGDIKRGTFDAVKSKDIISKAKKGKCRKCLAFHGYLNELNLKQ